MLEAMGRSFGVEAFFTDVDGLERQPEYQGQGSRALLWAIFESGIESYCRATETGAIHGPEFRETERWVFSSGSGLTAFSTLCDIFEIDMRTLRLKLMDFRETPDLPHINLSSE
jgi:hypothetical protein